jgi:hypothetical protein
MEAGSTWRLDAECRERDRRPADDLHLVPARPAHADPEVLRVDAISRERPTRRPARARPTTTRRPLRRMPGVT